MSTLDEWIPACNEEMKPIIGKIFDTLEEGDNFYKSYAHASGFSVRNSSETTDKSGVKWKRKCEMDNSFYYDYEVDDVGRLKYVFWAYGICRKNYSLFGDVVSFGTTYSTNKYPMIFAPYTGVNHHRQNITFGVAILTNEKADSFVWLFDTFLKDMGVHKPIVIIADQDSTMKIAIEEYQSSDPRLSERFSPERERITWEGEILDYTGRFSPEREFPRLGEKWQTGVVVTVRFSLEREGTC
ncbi:hypothetical protein Lal_00027053 [Lupinus albus]|nr:hypothetical protein Lal_00027053 [Lupinus albus]